VGAFLCILLFGLIFAAPSVIQPQPGAIVALTVFLASALGLASWVMIMVGLWSLFTKRSRT
jgi:uncharacterized membrane protein